nr:MAG TPA: hypothetical protein [Caudoviricetes sp.]
MPESVVELFKISLWLTMIALIHCNLAVNVHYHCRFYDKSEVSMCTLRAPCAHRNHMLLY